jgi:hypothetical protein
VVVGEGGTSVGVGVPVGVALAVAVKLAVGLGRKAMASGSSRLGAVAATTAEVTTSAARISDRTVTLNQTSRGPSSAERRGGRFMA